METIAATPTASVPKACNGWGEKMAAYRFLDNASVDWQAILAPRLPTTRLVYVADREAGMLPLMVRAQQLGCPADWLGTIERIERALALYLVVAWRIACLMRMGRACPDLDAQLFFERDEIQAAYLLNKKLAPPTSSLNDVLRMVAHAGGFLARKGDGEPGAKTIWEGLRDVRASAHTLKTLREMGMLSSCV